jgi:hypothetical protein
MPRYNNATRYDLYVLQDINMLQLCYKKRIGDPLEEIILRIRLPPKSVMSIDSADLLLLSA